MTCLADRLSPWLLSYWPLMVRCLGSRVLADLAFLSSFRSLGSCSKSTRGVFRSSCALRCCLSRCFRFLIDLILIEDYSEWQSNTNQYEDYAVYWASLADD